MLRLCLHEGQPGARWLRYREGVPRLLGAAAVALGAAVVAAGLVTTVTTIRVMQADERQRRGLARGQQGDYLLVLGAKAYPDGPSNELRARLDHAVQRWYEGAAPIIGVSGGISGTVDESEVMAAYVQSQGVEAGAIQRIVPGSSTRESMESMAVAAPGATVLAVSSPYHAHRMEAEGRRHGLAVIADCPPTTPESRVPEIHASRLTSEVLASLLYAAPPSTVGAARTVAAPVRRKFVRTVARAGESLRSMRRDV